MSVPDSKQTDKMSPNTGQPARRRRGWLLCSGLLVVCLLAGGTVCWLMRDNNFHVVVAGRIYRSAQMDRKSLVRVIQERDIKTVLNLRGPGGEDWYNAETNTTQQMGLKHIDFTLSAGQELTDVQMDALMATIDSAPKPLLIHCKSGSDRTGLAGALYLYTFEGQPPEVAVRELTIFRGHFPYLFWRDTAAMDRSFWRYVGTHARQTGQTGVKSTTSLLKQEIPPVAADR